jgi:pimeloyl-ACP methyl ester carboxylesterase
MSKLPLLLLHGAIGSQKQLAPLAGLLQADYEVHTLNFSGHGGEALPGRFSIELFAKDVLRYLEQHSIPKADIFGYSMGGYVALWLAGHYPDQVQRVFTLATKFDWDPVIAEREIGMLIPEKIEEKLPGFANTLKERHAPEDWKQVLHKTAAMMLEMGRQNPLSPIELSAIRQHVIVCVGDRDKMVSLKETMEASARIPNSHFQVLPDTLHPIEQVPLEKLKKELNAFFR